MKDPLNYPLLRHPLEISLEHLDNQEILLFRCPLGIAKPLGLIKEVAPLISFFDGNTSVKEIAGKFQDQGANESIVTELVSLLDRNLMLDSPAFHERAQLIKKEFNSASVRLPETAGSSYPADPELLKKLIDTILTEAETPLPEKRPLLGLIAPHIEYRRGRKCYGYTYKHLKAADFDLCILLGVGHQYSPYQFHMTRKDFSVPTGAICCDKTFVDEVAETYGKDRAFADEFLHKEEHSIEFQLPFLLNKCPECKIVPILMGSFFSLIQNGESPSESESYESFINALAAAVKKRREAGLKVGIIAGVDLAHVGQYFGDQEKLSAKRMEKVQVKDDELLNYLTDREADNVFSHILEDQDARRVCGFPVLYLLLDLLKRLDIDCEIVKCGYEQAVDYQSDCAVTFTGMALYENGKVAG